MARRGSLKLLRKWLEGLRSWSGAYLRYLPESELVLFERALRSRVDGAPLVHPRVLNPGLPLHGALPVVPSFNPGTPRLKPNPATLRARFVLAIEPFLLAGWVAVYLDGSSELVHGVRIGGFGVCSDAGLSFSSPLPVHDPQTNIRAELWAALWALRRHQPGVREVFCTDSNLVFLGVTGGWRHGGSDMGGAMHQDQFHMWTIGRRSWGSAYASWGKCAGSRYQHTVGCPETRTPTPSPTRAGWTALFICFLWRRVELRGPLTRTRVLARHMIWLRTNPFWSRWRGWSPWRTALITTRTRTGGGVWGRGGTGGETVHPPSSVPAGLLVPSVGVVGRHVAAPLGEPDPEFRIWVRLTPPPPYLRPPVWCWTVLVCGLCFTTWANAPVARHRARRSARRKGKGGSSDSSGSIFFLQPWARWPSVWSVKPWRHSRDMG